MNELEMKLKDLIKERYGALSKFAESIDMPWTTLDSILKRGIVNSNIANVLKNNCNEITIEEEVRLKALNCLLNMHELAR